jgi:hypothetical protein
MTVRHWVLATLALLLGGDVQACSVPVFRYALEHWAPSRYEAVVLHRGPLSSAALRAVQTLEEAPANLTVHQVDAGEVEGSLRRLWEKSDPQMSSAWLVLRRDRGEENAVVWSGPLTEANATAVVDSPARREIVRRLADGESAVFVVLTSGREEADAPVMRELERALPRLRRLTLPEQAAAEISQKCPVPLKVAFSVLRVERSTAAEDLFCRLLLNVDELQQPEGPVVFPVFGRGRALAALPGADIDADVLHHTATFLCGACSCEVKDLESGGDLLLSADWEALLSPPDDAPGTVKASVPVPYQEMGQRPSWLSGCIVVAGVLVLITGARALGWRGRRPSTSPPP